MLERIKCWITVVIRTWFISEYEEHKVVIIYTNKCLNAQNMLHVLGNDSTQQMVVSL